MKKYLQVFKISWQDSFAYRLNFFLWRLRTIFWILASYFFWLVVYQNRTTIGGYNQQSMFTYILGVFILSDLILSSLSVNLSVDISTGNLSNQLVKPVNIYYYWLARDWADKLLNLLFSLAEIAFVFVILRPPIFINLNFVSLIIIAVAVFLALLLNFFLNFLVSLLAFWFPEHGGWPQRFLFSILLSFFAGLYFPLDIFPKIIYQIFQILPTSYLIFFPLQIYLGRISSKEILVGFFLMVAWTLILIKVNKIVWRQGIAKYSSEGR